MAPILCAAPGSQIPRRADRLGGRPVCSSPRVDLRETPSELSRFTRTPRQDDLTIEEPLKSNLTRWFDADSS